MYMYIYIYIFRSLDDSRAHCPCVRVFTYIPIVSQGGEAPSQDSNTIHFPETSDFIDCQILGLHPKSYPVTRFSRPAILSPNIE